MSRLPGAVFSDVAGKVIVSGNTVQKSYWMDPRRNTPGVKIILQPNVGSNDDADTDDDDPRHKKKKRNRKLEPTDPKDAITSSPYKSPTTVRELKQLQHLSRESNYIFQFQKSILYNWIRMLKCCIEDRKNPFLYTRHSSPSTKKPNMIPPWGHAAKDRGQCNCCCCVIDPDRMIKLIESAIERADLNFIDPDEHKDNTAILRRRHLNNKTYPHGHTNTRAILADITYLKTSIAEKLQTFFPSRPDLTDFEQLTKEDFVVLRHPTNHLAALDDRLPEGIALRYNTANVYESVEEAVKDEQRYLWKAQCRFRSDMYSRNCHGKWACNSVLKAKEVKKDLTERMRELKSDGWL
ncbi:hypothetical protein HDU97_005729 [Phlyctochytrium planicorne]|nr:hypothetical protein HDU97_005729 [Phlyctochytrium planicorne]